MSFDGGVMKGIATAMLGGLAASVMVAPLVYPVTYNIWKDWRAPEEEQEETPAGE